MLIGTETEFGIFGGWSLEVANQILGQVRVRHAHLPAVNGGIFLSSGGRAYVDQGKQAEYSTGECDDPLLLVRHELAGRSLMQEAAARCGEVLLCSNVDYATSNAWGHHENYELERPLADEELAVMLTHLATRIVYTGAGGPHPRLPGLRPVMSPRASLTAAPISAQGTLRRSMIFFKPSSYGAGHRLHVTCGESLLSPRASWLKYGTTALVGHALAHGHLVGLPVLVNPLLTLHRLNGDLGLRREFAMSDGSRLGGVAVQRSLLEDLEAVRETLPAWSETVLVEWRRVLDGLEQRARTLDQILDWRMYLRLWRTLCRERGFDDRERWRAQRDLAAGRELSRGDEYRKLCAAGRELYVRLHALGEDSLATRVARAGWLETTMPGLEPERIRECWSAPPPGRARNRARLVELLRERRGMAVTWEAVIDEGRSLVASIPHDQAWGGALRWESLALRARLPEPPEDPIPALADAMRPLPGPARLEACFRRGDYEGAVRAFEGGEVPTPRLLDWSTVALSYARSGRATEARAALANAEVVPGDAVSLTAAKLFCAVNFGLAPPAEECRALLAEAEAKEAEYGVPPVDPVYTRGVLGQCRGWILVNQGRMEEGIEILRETTVMLTRDWRPRMLARTCCWLADGLRRIGKEGEAREALSLPTRIYLAEQLAGDSAEHLAPVLARLGDTSLLGPAEELQRQWGSGLGLARTLCLAARVERREGAIDELRALRDRVEVLRDCPVLGRVIGGWAEWVGGVRRASEDEFWGV